MKLVLRMDLESIEPIRSAVLAAIAPVKAAGPDTPVPKDFLDHAKRTEASRQLPAYYLVYFLLVDLLGFKDLGEFEKVAWSVPLDFEGRAFLIEHRKSGVGVFGADLPGDEKSAGEIVRLIRKGVKIAQPYFDWRAAEAVKDSKLNVVNRSMALYERLRFFMDQYEGKRAEAARRADEKIVTRMTDGETIYYPVFGLRLEAKWLALSLIECFFSWTEHVFIHLAILRGKCATGDEVAGLAAANWGAKFKAALDLNDAVTKQFYDQLIVIRRQLRNFVAHGSFGKDGEAFHWHSGAGAVPVRLPHHEDGASFRFGRGIEFVDHDAITLIHEFIGHIWSGPRAPARAYLQETDLPLILTMVRDGSYARAMASEADMAELVEHLVDEQERHADMDF